MNADLLAFGQVVAVDLILAGDNAVIIGALAANLPSAQRTMAVTVGIMAAVAARIILSLGVVWLLLIPGVMIIGALLLFWVAWKLWRDLRSAENAPPTAKQPGSLSAAILAIVLADLSMSLDNVLGVAGAAQGHALAMVFGLVLSIALMGAAAAAIAAIITRHRWIAYVGLALIVFVAARMLWHGSTPLIA
jgi:YjbE family integral membrane protein